MAANLLETVKITKVQNATAAGTSDVNCDSVNMAGYDSVVFFTTFGTITAGAATEIHVETSSDDSTFNDLAGTAITVADDDDNQIFGSEIVKPLEQYLRLVITRATQNAVIGECYAVQYNAKDGLAIANTVTDAATFETHVSPAEGTK